jgi:tRNA pseudouridine13 synthase
MPDPNDVTLPDWQRICGIPTASGRLRSQPEDFRVVEIPGFELSGDGEHDFLRIEKINANTNWVAQGLAHHANVPVRDVGFAGMKDRHAVTRQWFSVRRPGGTKANWGQLDLQGVLVLDVARHNRKMRRGAHNGNRFELLIRAISDPDSTLEKRLKKIGELGVPNYFGEQRFGRNGSNIGLAQIFFAGRRMSREKRSIALSSARSLIFNNVLSARVSAGDWDTLTAGDVANLDGSGSVFPVPVLDDEISKRCREFDIHPSGVLWGKGAPTTGGEPRALECEIAAKEPLLMAGLERHTDEGRRALRLVVRDLEWEIADDNLSLSCSLMRGGFATAVLRELVRYDS